MNKQYQLSQLFVANIFLFLAIIVESHVSLQVLPFLAASLPVYFPSAATVSLADLRMYV